MTEKDAPPNFVLSIDPMLANIDEITEEKYELVFIYGYLGKVTGETVRLYQGLDLRRHYEIPWREIVHVAMTTCTEGCMSKLVLFSTTRIVYVSGTARATLPVSALAEVVASYNGNGRKPDGVSKCPVGCVCNGKCTCPTIDYWFNLNEETARKLGVVVSCAPSRTE